MNSLAPKNYVGISGSLRLDSTNSKLLQATARISEDNQINFTITDLVGKLPLFSPDIDATRQQYVEHWTKLIRECDGIIISTPEYARGYPGSLKNAFDWLVQGDGFVSKPFMFLRASPRADLSHSSLKVVLETMSGIHMSQADGLVPLLGTNLTIDEICEDQGFANTIRKSLLEFDRAVRALAVGND